MSNPYINSIKLIVDEITDKSVASTLTPPFIRIRLNDTDEIHLTKKGATKLVKELVPLMSKY